MQLAAVSVGGPFILIGLVGLALSIWAIVDVVSRPDWAFQAAGSSKTLWIVLEVLGLVICGVVLSLIYLLAIRPKVARAQAFGSMGSGRPVGWTPPPPGWTQPPPGWTQPPPSGWTQPPPSGWTQPPPSGWTQPPPGWTPPPPTDAPSTPPAPPGWYPDPAGSGGSRYWDGTGWSEQTH